VLGRGRPHLRRLASGVACGLVAGLAMTIAAGVSPAATARAKCDSTQTQPFKPWGDLAQYVLAPGGALEPGSNSWSLSHGAAIVAGNEPFHVHDPGDSSSLSLPSGASAKTDLVCLGLTSPTLRFFAVNTGSLTATLEIVVYFRSRRGNLLGSAPVATLVAGTTWQPTVPIPAFGNVTAPVGTKYVQYKFKPVGAQSGWQIDDVYVDPWLSR
jgi:hypothetical protein